MRRARPRRAARRAVAVGFFGLVSTLAAAAFGLWLSSGLGASSAAAQQVNAGNQPVASVSGSSVTLSWSASTLSGGGPVSGYRVTRYNSSDVAQTIGASCNGVIAGLTCTETNVPNGTWKYSVTPVQGSWSGAESPKTTVNVAALTVTSTNPSSRGQGAANQNITVTGTNFVNGASASFSSTGITVNSTTFNTSTQLTANITISGTAPTGARNVTVTNPDASAGSCTGCFTVNAGPSPTSVNPSALDQGGSRTITISGTSFQTGATVVFTPSTGVTLGPLTVTATTITATATIAGGAPLGARDVTVTNPDQGTGTCGGCFTVQGTPTVTSVDPPALDRGGTQNVTITGTNFVNGTLTASFGAGITVNSVTYVSPIQATANLTVASGAATGSRSVTLTNSDGTTSPACTCFTVQAVPTVASVSPAAGDQGGSNPNVTITGTNFVVGPMTAVFSGAGVTATNFVATSSTQATGTVSVAPSAATGNRNITITNSDGTSASKNGVFTVQAPPTVTSTSPALGQGAISEDVTINGANFVGDSSPVVTPSVAFASGVTVNSVIYNAANKLTANVTVSQSAPTGGQAVTVTNPDGTTASGTFTVNAGPKPTSVNTAVGRGATNKSITITGTGFQTGGGNVTVTFSGSGVASTTATNTASSSTSITMNVNVAANADLGAHDVTVTNKTDHGVGTCTGCLTVNPAPQFAAVTPVSPTSGVRSTTITMTINGSNFDPNVTVTFSKGGFVINTKVVSGGGTVITLNVTLPGGAGATNITLLNPDGGTSTLTTGFTVT